MSNLHYTKSGKLDMRYSSSKAAVASGHSGLRASSSSTSSYRGGNWGYGGGSSEHSASFASSGLHYKKDGTLDMRYKSSQQAASAYYMLSTPAPVSNSSGLHFKKDGTLDMRYKSSQEAVARSAPPPAPASTELHLKKDGSLDMRYRSSRDFVEKMGELSVNSSTVRASKGQSKSRLPGIPSYVPVTSTGAPDLRTSQAKVWVQQQAQLWHPSEALPAWVPRLKDGSPDMTKAAARHFIGASPVLDRGLEHDIYDVRDQRASYYETKRQQDEHFNRLMEMQHHFPVEMISEPEPVRATANLREAFASVIEEKEDDAVVVMPLSAVAQINYDKELEIDDDAEPLGQGGFGTVYRGVWNEKDVAIKKLHETKLTKKERKMFIRETLILGLLGDHPNIVQLFGYTLNPTCLVMEYVPKGSLSYLLHYCEDAEVEAKMTDGRVKHNILLGIAYGMIQLHACGVTHGDLKPQNVLITDEFHAKIADFGLATFRAKAASTTSSHMLSGSKGDDGKDADYEGVVGGTAAYMAPELLDGNAMANEKTDVYAFGVLMNELLHEEEPYQQNLRQFVGKGPFAAVLFAKSGNRPRVHDRKVTPELKQIIEKCWSAAPGDRPTFGEVAKLLVRCTVPHACS